MKKNEQDVLHVIDEKTEEVIVPESLKPEQIEQVKKAEEKYIRQQGLWQHALFLPWDSGLTGI